MADIFVSYTSSDRDWAFWIGQELEALGHRPRIHEWELSGGADIVAWMETQHDAADHVLCIISQNYLSAAYSSWERRAAQMAAIADRPNFVLPVRIEPCKMPTLLAPFKRCDVFGLAEEAARIRLKDFLAPAARPERMPFPGKIAGSVGDGPHQGPRRFPGGVSEDAAAEIQRLLDDIHQTIEKRR